MYFKIKYTIYYSLIMINNNINNNNKVYNLYNNNKYQRKLLTK